MNSGYEWDSSRARDDAADEDSLDEILTRKSSLAFLCKVNADYKEIERYLSAFPEALLFGAEENDLEGIVSRQMEECTCFGKTCSHNRRLILRALRRGFEFYRGIRLVDLVDDDFFNNGENRLLQTYNSQLKALERDLRNLRQQEAELDNRLAQAMQEVADLRCQIENGSRSRPSHLQSQILKLQCRKVKTHAFEERASVEGKLAAATLAISSLEEDRKLVQTEIATALRLQHAFLKKSFSGCKRHICNASKHEL